MALLRVKTTLGCLAAMRLSLASADGTASSMTTFGPKHCVSVSRSEKTGTCVLKTNCEGANLDAVEFAFTCRKPGVVQKHSFGKGGFDPVEEFDTSVKCDMCGLPSEVALSLKHVQFLGTSKSPSSSAAADKVEAKVKKAAENLVEKKHIKLVGKKQEPAEGAEPAAEEKAEEPAAEEAAPAAEEAAPAAEEATPAAEAATEETAAASEPAKVSYGPQNCITTWLQKDAATTTTTTTTVAGAETTETSETTTVPVTDGEAGVCIVSTNCGHIPSESFVDYPVGVIAVNKDNVPVRHLFGKNSFDPKEEFNTLIRASACVGMDQTAEAITLDNEVKALSRIVFALKGQVQKMAGTTSEQTELIRKDHDLLVKNDEAAEKDREDEERERLEEERQERLRDERAAERYQEDDGMSARSAVQLDGAESSEDGDDEEGQDLPPEFRDEQSERMARRAADSTSRD